MRKVNFFYIFGFFNKKSNLDWENVRAINSCFNSKKDFIYVIFVAVFFLNQLAFAENNFNNITYKVLIIDSYHRTYLWSKETNHGVIDAFYEAKLLNHMVLKEAYYQQDFISSNHIILRAEWMDTKAHPGKRHIANQIARLNRHITEFKPDVLLLGDDNAVNYIGNQYLDTDIPIVFWGVNGKPGNYGLIDNIEKPGHNVTGVYQAGYLEESLEYLIKLIPSIKTFAILSDDSKTGRSKAKFIQQKAREGVLRAELVDTVTTNQFSIWKQKALELASQVDAFMILNHNTIRDDQGEVIDQLAVGNWYLKNINKPECAGEKQFAQEGMLLVVDDSGYKQGYEAAKKAVSILKDKSDPASMRVIAPSRGSVIVNQQRAESLKIDLSNKKFIEDFITESLALKADFKKDDVAQ